MDRPLRLLAVDLGAESGRAIVGTFDGSRLRLEVAHRFPNVPVRMRGTLYWDFPRLFGDVLDGIRAAGKVASVGVDGWGVDFGLLDARGRLIVHPVHYRDSRTAGMVELACQRVSRERIYAETGVQLIPINTLYQLLSMTQQHDPDLERAESMLMIPDLVHHFLCDSVVGEYTNATTTQCYDVSRGKWATALLEDLNIPLHLFPEIVQPGTVLGPLRVDVAQEVGARLQVIAPATHDTASAVVATPLNDGTAFLSSGTWSLLGLELNQAVLTDAMRKANLTNEGGVAGTVRLLKNVMGLWLVQQARGGLDHSLSYEQLTGLAHAATPFTAFIDPDDERFLRPGDLPASVRGFCVDTHQPPPEDAATLVRVLLESLALKYAVVLHQLQAASGRRLQAVHVVGGGSNNALLCQLTADACALPVLAGPAEATAMGNLVVQAMALGELSSVADGRALVGHSFPAVRYEPSSDWTEARERFHNVLEHKSQARGVLQ